MKMKKNIYVILLGITMGLMSCSRVYDDITNYTNLTPDAVWTDESYSTQYINQLYGNMMNYVTQSDAPATEENDPALQLLQDVDAIKDHVPALQVRH